MKIILHEIELNGADVESSRDFYHEVLGLPIAVDQDGLKVFDSGWPGLDLDISIHNPSKTKISFLVDDLNAFIDDLMKKGYGVGDSYETHLGMQAVSLEDPDGNLVEIQSPTDQSPQFLHDMVKSLQ